MLVRLPDLNDADLVCGSLFKDESQEVTPLMRHIDITIKQHVIVIKVET